MNLNYVVVTDFNNPWEDVDVTILRDSLSKKGFREIASPFKYPVNFDTLMNDTKKFYSRKSIKNLEFELRNYDWNIEKLLKFKLHSKIKDSFNEINQLNQDFESKNNALLSSYREIANSEDRIISWIINKHIPMGARYKTDNFNSNVIVLTKNYKTLADGIFSGNYMKYHSVSRGFFELASIRKLGWDNSIFNMHMSLKFTNGFTNREKEAYLNHVLNHELGHYNYDLQDHHDGRDCIMTAHSQPDIHLQKALFVYSDKLFCDSCTKKMNSIYN